MSAVSEIQELNHDLVADETLRTLAHMWTEFNTDGLDDRAKLALQFAFYRGAWAVFILLGCGAGIGAVMDESTAFIDKITGQGNLQ